jgi:hypothetical protein
MIRLPKLPHLAAIAALSLGFAVPAAAQSVVIERTSAQTAPGHFTPAVTITRNGPPQVVRLGEQGLSRANYWDDAALIAWGAATFNARATIYTVPDIPEKFD